MRKRITASAILAALLILAAVIVIPYMTRTKTDTLVVGSGAFSGSTLPVFAGKEGDETAKSFSLSTLKYKNADTTRSASYEVPSVASDFRVYFADGKFNETKIKNAAEYTAARYVIKNGAKFSDGTPITADDVVFSLYLLLDPLSEWEGKADFENLLGYRDFALGVKGISDLIDEAKREISSSAEDDAIEKYLAASGEEFATRIRSYVLDNYTSKGDISLYMIDSATPYEIKSNEAYANAYTMRMWNYGAFIYEYQVSEAGDYVGTLTPEGDVVYKTTYDKAMSDDSYTTYVTDEDGTYTLSGGVFHELAKGEEGPRFAKVLKDGFVRLTRSAVTGFRDAEGNAYTLSGTSYPSMSDFFKLMRNAYTSNGTFDYEAMERVEGVDDFSFSDDAAMNFALSSAEGDTPYSITGITRESSSEGDVITFYFCGSDYYDAYNSDIYVLSAASCLNGYDVSRDTLSIGGCPISSEAFFDHLKKVSTVSAGPYKVRDAKDGEMHLAANEFFASLTSDGTLPETPYITVRDVSGKTLVEAFENGVAAYNLPIAKNSLSSLDENVTPVYFPTPVYKYLMINPTEYKNIEVRRAIASTIDTSVMTDNAHSAISRCIPTYYDSYAGETPSLYDKTGESALTHFLAAGYTQDEEGNLLDSTSKKASFTFTLTTEDKGTVAERMVKNASSILKSLGADCTVEFDAGLRGRVFSGSGASIYILGWDLSSGLSMYERYAYTSGSDASRACGVDRLFTFGQLDALGKITFGGTDGVVRTSNQSDAVEEVDRAIVSSSASTDREAVNASLINAERIISDLTFEIPLCEYNSVYLFDSDAVDLTSLPENMSIDHDPLSEVWKIIMK